MKKHINIPIFIPHLGCPNQCIFCNQRYISGTTEFHEEDVKKQIESVLSSVEEESDVEIAFFGGSFTGIDRSLMIRLLDTAQKYVDDKRVSGIRMSTRPDYISNEIIEILKKYSVSFVELGIQSMNNDVLKFLKRGHSKEDTVIAVNLLIKANIPFIGQMMIGLPSSTVDDEIECAEQICDLGASGCRIYPTLVLKNTELEFLTKENIYKPLTSEEAIIRTAKVLSVFHKNKVPCIRIGLCDSDKLHSSDTFVAGPNDPSIGEKVQSELYFNRICDLLNEYGEKENKELTVYCNYRDVSKIIGNKKTNLRRLQQVFRLKDIKIKNCEDIKQNEIKIVIEE